MGERDGLSNDLRDVPREDIFKLRASVAASEICEWVHFGIDALITHHKYQVNPDPSLWFLDICAAAKAHSFFFRLYKENKFSESEVKLRQANNHCKKALEAAKFGYGSKTKEPFIH